MMSRTELLTHVQHLFSGDGPEEYDIALVRRLSDEFPVSRISDLIFWHKPDLSPEEVVAKVFMTEK